MRLPTMRQLERAGADAGRLLDAFAEYWALYPGRSFSGFMDAVSRNGGIIAMKRRRRAFLRRRREFFGG